MLLWFSFLLTCDTFSNLEILDLESESCLAPNFFTRCEYRDDEAIEGAFFDLVVDIASSWLFSTLITFLTLTL